MVTSNTIEFCHFARLVTVLTLFFVVTIPLTQSDENPHQRHDVYLFKCQNSDLTDFLNLPQILQESQDGDENRARPFILKVRDSPCETRLWLSLNLSSGSTSTCNVIILQNGSLHVNGDEALSYSPEHYCFDRLTSDELKIYFCDDGGNHWSALEHACPANMRTVVANNEEPKSPDRAQDYIRYVLLIGPSTCALIDAAIIVVYFLLWGKQSCYGWSIIALCCSQLVFYAGVVAIPSMTLAYQGQQISLLNFLWICTSSVLTIQMAFLCSYTWTLVLAFHVWRMLSKLSATSSSSQGLKRFLMYCSVAYGIPLTITAISVAVISSKNSNYPENCFEYLQFYLNWFVYLPTGIIFVCNAILMYGTVKLLLKAKKNRGNLRVHGKSAEDSAYLNAILIVKLMVLMGAFLALDMIIHFIDFSGIGENIYTACFEYAYRIVHAGCLFWIFVCNKETYDQLTTRFPLLAQMTAFQKNAASSPVTNATTLTS